MAVGTYILNRNGLLCKQPPSLKRHPEIMGFQSGSPPPTTPEQEAAILAAQPITQQQMQQMMLDMMNQLATLLKNNPQVIVSAKGEIARPSITIDPELQIDDSIVDVSSSKDLDRFEKKYDRITEDKVSEDSTLKADQDKLRQLLKGKK